MGTVGYNQYKTIEINSKKLTIIMGNGTIKKSAKP